MDISKKHLMHSKDIEPVRKLIMADKHNLVDLRVRYFDVLFF